MKTMIETRTKTETDLQHEVSGFMFTVVSTSAVILGIWGIACLIGGLISSGFIGMIKGYVTAITGM